MLYKRFRDEDFDRLARLLSKPRPRAAIEGVGDIDYPSRLVLPLLWAEPRLGLLFLKVVLRRSDEARASAPPDPPSSQGAHGTHGRAASTPAESVDPVAAAAPLEATP